MDRPVGAARAAWLLTRLRLRRQFNQLRSGFRFKKTASVRVATARKRSTSWLLSGLCVLAIFFNSFNLSHHTLANMETALGTAEVQPMARHGWLGIRTAPVTPTIADRLGIVPPHGVLVTGIVDSSPAQSAGLQSGDVVVRIGDADVTAVADLQHTISTTPPGTIVQFVIVRDGGPQRKTVTLTASPTESKPAKQAVAPAPGTVLAPGVLRGATFETTLLLLAALFMTLASLDFARPDWDLEWLITLPLPLSTLLSSRLIERAATNAIGLLTLFPFLTMLAWQCGYRWGAPVAGFGLAIALLFVAATFQTLVDTGLRLSLSPPKLRNLRAVFSVVGILPFLLAMAPGTHADGFIFGWADALPDWTRFLPTGLAVQALAATDAGSAAFWMMALIGETLAIVAIGSAVLHRQLRFGVVTAGIREAGLRSPRATQKPAPAARSLLSVVQRRELRLLGRDRTFFVQTLVLPAIMVGAQVFINARANVFEGAVDHPENLAAIAFALAAYTLMLSAFQTLNSEGQSLWILYCVPRSLEFVLRQKAILWAVLATIYPLAVFAIAIGMAGHVTLAFLGCALVALLGIPIFAVIATALGIFGCDPLAQEVRRRVRPTTLYLYMLLVALYAYAIYASTIWQRAGMIILSALLAIALWQKARDRFDTLLDPSASPPSLVSVSDGLIAALMFFVLQAIVGLAFRLGQAEIADAPLLTLAFCIAGALTYGAMRLVYWRARTSGVPRLFGADVPHALLWGFAGGIAASIAGIAYLQAVSSMHLLPGAHAADLAATLWFAVLAIAAAPVFEEFIFRGLVFGGLRRLFGLYAAMPVSAAIFAIIHPPLSVVPVFVLGLCTAFVYERTRMLIAPMLVHALYNAAVLGFQWTMLQ